MHSSQNEQDSRFYARSAHVPMLEPSDSQEAKDFVALAFELSEKYDTPVFLRTTTRLAHSQSFVNLSERVSVAPKSYQKDVRKYTMMPASAVLRHIEVEKREDRLQEDVNSFSVNKIEYNDLSLGVVCSGVVYQYVKEALPDASVFKLGVVYPLPFKLLREFSKTVKELVVIEELEPFFENQLKAHGISARGKELFSKQGEISVALIKEKLLGVPQNRHRADLPPRPPVMCAGCPHRGVFYILNKLKLTVTGDIGCYTLGALPPLNAVDTVLCMGASIGMAHGFKKALLGEAKNVVAVIGDSTFIHSGLTGLVNAVYNKSNLKLIILDNSTTGMTGHQQHPATGVTLSGEATVKLNLESAAKALGADSVVAVDAYDLTQLEKIIKEEMQKDGVSVIIARRPCALLSRDYPPPYAVSDCKKCGMCFKIGCPAIEKTSDGTAKINASLCTGCGVCKQLCKFNAISEGKK